MPQIWISEVLPPPHLCFPGSHRRWQIFNIYTVSYTLIASCTNCQSRFIRPLISCQTLLGASVCPCSSVFLPSRCSCTAGTCPWHREMLGMLPLHSTGPAVSISVRTLLIQGCIQGAGTELPVNVALINPIIDGIRSECPFNVSPVLHTCSGRESVVREVRKGSNSLSQQDGQVFISDYPLMMHLQG